MGVLNIAIVGAGPAGCMLARILQHSSNPNIRVTVFEGESGLDFRSQGGTLDLHEKTGQAALVAGGLFDAFLKYARYDGEAIKICDKNVLCYVSMGGASKPKANSTQSKVGGRPEIDRPRLRQILYESLAEGTVQWNRKLVRVDDDRTLHFADGTSASGFDLVVGADGAWSRVRPRVSQVKPQYSGIAGYSLQISDAERTQPELSKLVNRGSLFAFSNGKSIMSQQMGDGSLNVSSWELRPVDWQTASTFDVHDAAAVKANICERFADWDPRLVNFIRQSDGRITPRDLYMLPVGHRWDHVPGVTLIGDASHLMTPFAGEGVNLALADSLKLSEVLLVAASSPDPQAALDAQVLAFEHEMFARASETQQLTLDMMNIMYFTPGAPRSSIEQYILRAMSDELGVIGTKLMTPLVYAWFAVFKLLYNGTTGSRYDVGFSFAFAAPV